ncbi:RNA polymerase sigma factor [Sphingomonas sp. Root241]|uniref:RNA polymerase sigma factor n=1 Tax=Sphingomonas sp. Root241 TaxID=1736501 RepID=UPI000700493D|nr:sigma-70 family RNA polymerase sigma factor [Sphingomonas sp. Root241]KRC81644.1 hypothetical protein ASE13_04495 [Sphingomonas sp. Root241]
MRPAAASEEPQIDDELLVTRCQLGERRAFDELAVRWAASVAGYARHVSEDGDAAAELTQDIWLRVLRGIDRLHDPARFRSWLFGIAHRAFIDTLRSRYRAFPSTADDADHLAEDEPPDHDHEAMERGLARLPPVEREVLSLFYLQELTIEETAGALSVPSGTIKSRLHRARRLLRLELEKEI